MSTNEREPVNNFEKTQIVDIQTDFDLKSRLKLKLFLRYIIYLNKFI